MCLELVEHHKIGFYTATRFYEGEENKLVFLSHYMRYFG